MPTQFVILIQAVFCCALMLVLSGWVFPFSMDSLFYISTAEHIARFQGFVFSNFSVYPPAPEVLSSVVLHPPGYPLLIALLKLCGIPEYAGALFIPRACFLALPFLFFMVFRRGMTVTLALIAAFVGTFTFAIVKCSLMAWSDIPYLCLTLISFWMALRIIEEKGRAPFLFIVGAGAVAGYALLIKYIGMTLIAAILTGFAVAFVLKRIPLKTFLKTAGCYILGVLLFIGPMVAHNMLLFRTAIPYKMPPSSVPLPVHLHDYFREMAQLMFASPLFEGAIVLLLLAALVFFIRRAGSWARDDKGSFIWGVMLGAYFAFNSIFLIAFKVFCYGPEPIDDRYLIQISWILMGACVWALGRFFSWIRAFRPLDIKTVTGMLLLAFLLIQVFPASDFYFFEERLKAQAAKVEQYAPMLRDLPDDHVIVSNVPDLTYYFVQRNVRMLAGYTPEALASVLAPVKNYAVFLLKEEEFLVTREYFRYWQAAPGYVRGYSDENVDILLMRAAPAGKQ